MDAGEGNGDNVILKRCRTLLSDSEDIFLLPGVCYSVYCVCSHYILSMLFFSFFLFFNLKQRKRWSEAATAGICCSGE